MMEWLRAHQFLAAWLGPVVGIIGLVLQQTNKKEAFSFRAFTIYLTFFLLLGLKLTPGFDSSAKMGIDVVWIMCFFAILWDQLGASALSVKRQNLWITPPTNRKPQQNRRIDALRRFAIIMR